MLKYLLVIGVIAAIYFLFIKKKPAIKNNTTKDKTQSSEMVECFTCKIYCELDDALLSNNKYYCSQECLEKAQ